MTLCSTLARGGCGCCAFYPLDEYKTPHSMRALPRKPATASKSFLLLFFKKEALAFLPKRIKRRNVATSRPCLTQRDAAQPGAPPAQPFRLRGWTAG
jgi:hypothetical protein